ncbi:MAG: hypothetical protein HY005_02935 [Candidatus Staskawiczbacteria bacterium]|nr:hypothetical protein [Candidatus Staskawiczbacteria bacterium]MBI3337548.1 hypothetical protein [Candidatus Staskawiczbacteria bacterium]
MLIGHKKQWDFLKNKLESGQLAHAYLFSGEEKIGKRTLAKEFVKLINCLSAEAGKSPGQESCGICRNCKDIENESYVDVLMVNLKNDKQEIDISQIREALLFLSYKSYYGSFKAVIVNGAEKMNFEAQSCLLKTLEEPKGKTILILISPHPETLLSTIISRCQRIKFYLVDPKEIEYNLVKMGESLPAGRQEKIAHDLASFCSCKPGQAIELFLNPDKLKEEQTTLQELVKVINSNLALKFQYTKKINLDGNNTKRVLEILQRYLRHLLFLKTGADNLTPKDFFPEAADNFKNYSISKIKEVLKLLEIINAQISLTNANPKLALEILLMEM